METSEIELKPFQVPLAAKQTEVLRREQCFLNAAGTGVGKTYLVVQTIKDLRMPTLVVCPKIAISQWRSVVEGMRATQYVLGIVNPEQLVKPIYGEVNGKRKVVDSGCQYYTANGGWTVGNDPPALLVFDELHRNCSGKDSKTGLSVARWCNKAHPGNKALVMSATPAVDPMHMRVLGYLMGFHRFVESSFYDWCRTHGCGYVDIGWGPSRRRIFRFTVDKELSRRIMSQIRDDMGERLLSVKPEDVPDFPDEVREIELIDLERRDHDALVKAYSEMPERITTSSKDDMVKVLRLRQQAEFCKAGTMAEIAADYVEDGYSVFIALNFTDARLRVEDGLRRRGVPFASIFGGQKESERQGGIAAFQSNTIHVMVGMMAACSVALSLHDDRHERPRVSLISPGYSASELSQSLGRIRRVGGTTAVQKIIIAAGSVEERVGKAIERKMDNLSALTDRDLTR